MNTWIQCILPASVLTAGLFFSASNGLARPDYTRRTKQECSYCHPSGGWYLTDAGKYFRDHRNLDGYKPPAELPKTANPGNQNQSNQKSTAQNNEKPKAAGK